MIGKWVRCAAAAMCITAPAAHAADPDLTSKAAEFLSICAKHMPKPSSGKQDWIGAGFNFQGRQDRSNGHLYTWKRQRVAGVVSSKGAKYDGCLVQVQNLSADEAAQVAGGVIRAAKAQSRNPTHPQNKKEWAGKLNGVPVRIGVSGRIWKDVAKNGHAVILEVYPRSK